MAAVKVLNQGGEERERNILGRKGVQEGNLREKERTYIIPSYYVRKVV